MGLWQKIKLLLKINSAVKEIEGAYKMNATKSGWKTTEFWGKVAVQIFTIYGMVSGLLPADKAAMILGILEGIYAIARAVVKAKGGVLPDIPGVTAAA